MSETDDLIARLKAMPPEHRPFACLFLDDEQAVAIGDRLDEIFDDDTAEALRRAAVILEDDHD